MSERFVVKPYGDKFQVWDTKRLEPVGSYKTEPSARANARNRNKEKVS